MTRNDPGNAMSGRPMGAVDAEFARLQKQDMPSLRETDIEGLLRDPLLANTVILSSFGAESAALLPCVTIGKGVHLGLLGSVERRWAVCNRAQTRA